MSKTSFTLLFRIGFVAALLLVLPLVALQRRGVNLLWAGGYEAVINALTYWTYSRDKRRAMDAEWRISEMTLHLLELLGGWPGAWIAQRRLRHKCSKLSYQAVFWLIVLAWQLAAVDSLQDWKLAKAALNRIKSTADHQRQSGNEEMNQNELLTHRVKLHRSMNDDTNHLPPPVNHVFVDYENVHSVDPSLIGSKMVHVTLLLGAKNTKFDAAVVEKLMQHAATVEMIRLTSSGRNALDFALAYYVGRAVLADPCGYFHIVSKDKGYDALIEHLRSKHIRARRHDDFTTLSTPTPPPKANSPAVASVAKATPSITALEALEARVLAHLRKPNTNRPRTEQKLISHLITHLGNKGAETDIAELLHWMSQAGHIVISDEGKVTYHLDLA